MGKGGKRKMKIVIDKLYAKDIKEVKVLGARKSANSFVRDIEIIMKTGEAIDLSIYSKEDDLLVRIFDNDKND